MIRSFRFFSYLFERKENDFLITGFLNSKINWIQDSRSTNAINNFPPFLSQTKDTYSFIQARNGYGIQFFSLEMDYNS